MLWVTETNGNRLNRIKLRCKTTVPPCGAHVPYRFTGCNGPDSCCIDDDDNLYVAVAESGRCIRRINMIFGLPMWTFFWTFVSPIVCIIITLIVALRGNYEGKKMEEQYGEDNWYWTF